MPDNHNPAPTAQPNTITLVIQYNVDTRTLQFQIPQTDHVTLLGVLEIARIAVIEARAAKMRVVVPPFAVPRSRG